jgi:hypothetical protein
MPIQHFWLISVAHMDGNQAHRVFVERRTVVIKKILVFVALLGIQTAYAQSCGAIQNQDRRNFCYARTKGNPGMCGAIREQDFRNYCFATLKGSKGMCGAIRNQDFRNECYANF